MSLLGSQPQCATPVPIRALTKSNQQSDHIFNFNAHAYARRTAGGQSRSYAYCGWRDSPQSTKVDSTVVLMDGAPCCVPTMLPTHTGKEPKNPAAAFFSLRCVRAGLPVVGSGGGEDAT